mgnify:CR=1 FL=1
MSQLLPLTSDKDVKITIKKLIEYSSDINFEHPRVDESIQLDVSIWPDLFWGKSKVALFLPNSKTEYDRLRIYDWHCYIITEDLDPETVFEYVIKEG